MHILKTVWESCQAIMTGDVRFVLLEEEPPNYHKCRFNREGRVSYTQV